MWKLMTERSEQVRSLKTFQNIKTSTRRKCSHKLTIFFCCHRFCSRRMTCLAMTTNEMKKVTLCKQIYHVKKTGLTTVHVKHRGPMLYPTLILAVKANSTLKFRTYSKAGNIRSGKSYPLSIGGDVRTF